MCITVWISAKVGVKISKKRYNSASFDILLPFALSPMRKDGRKVAWFFQKIYKGKLPPDGVFS